MPERRGHRFQNRFVHASVIVTEHDFAGNAAHQPAIVAHAAARQQQGVYAFGRL